MQSVRFVRSDWSAFAALAGAVVLACSLVPSSARADESGFFLVQLGTDTTSVESYTRSDQRLEIKQVGRSPRVTERTLVTQYANGVVTRFELQGTPAGETNPAQVLMATFDTDSVRLENKTGTAPVRKLAFAVPKDAVVVTNATPWSVYEAEIMKFVQGKSESVEKPLWFLGSQSMNRLTLRKGDKNSVSIITDRGDEYRARVDGKGRIQSIEPVVGPAQYSVQRLKSVDLKAFAATHAAREKSGKGMGTLSPRDTVTAFGTGSAITIDYSRPSKRGRVVYGGVVPYDQVWRTGANAATGVRIERAISFGKTLVPAGTYTLFTRPSASGWKLIFNSETGQWGTEHKPDKDVATVDMVVSTLPSVVEQFTIGVEPTVQGGLLFMDWDKTRASAEFVFAK